MFKDEESELKKSKNTEEHGNIRRRKRNFYNLIRDQMEFYFGDANLSKDRYLMQLIKQDPYVPLEVFLKFNKMKALVKTTADIAKSLSNSKLLGLNDDRTKVHRKIPLPENRDADTKSIYIEGIPASADHDWLKKIFGQISGGKVVYVALPRYKSRKLKEFGFIEFENEVCVEKCIKSFKSFNGVLCTDIDPSALQSIKSFNMENSSNKEEENKRKDISLETFDIANSHTTITLETYDAEDSYEPDRKRIKINENPQDLIDDNTADDDNDETSDGEETVDGDVPQIVKKKKKRQKKKQNKLKKQLIERIQVPLNKKRQIIAKDITTCGNDDKIPNKDDEEELTNNNHNNKNQNNIKNKSSSLNMESSIRQLKILQKKDWKILRNKYLNMQRQEISELKRKAWLEKQNMHDGNSSTNTNINKKNIIIKNKSSSSTSSVATATNKTKTFEPTIKHHMNFYMANNEIDSVSSGGVDDCRSTGADTGDDNRVIEHKSPLFNFQNGCIVKISLDEPCLDYRGFKADLRQYDYVKYVDVKEGSLEAYIRCDSAKMSQALCKQIQSAKSDCSILMGKAEEEYWAKIMSDRDMKINKNVKVQKKRGREKIAKIVANHTRFAGDSE